MNDKSTKKKDKTEINTIQKYLDAVFDKAIGVNLFYRGISDKNYLLVPGIYRGYKNRLYSPTDKTLIKYEHSIYREIISKTPEEFNGKSTLESLALMQHYGAPTRVLDLTQNPLVALYFAVEEKDDKNENKKDGEVKIFSFPNENVCTYDSDKVTILANIAKSEDDLDYELYDLNNIEKISKKLNSLKSQSLSKEKANKVGKEISNLLDLLTSNFKPDSPLIHKLLELKKKFKPTSSSNTLSQKELLNNIENFIDLIKRENFRIINDEYFLKFLHYIKEDKSYFLPIINPLDIQKVLVVKPKLDNPRIIRQSGALLIFGISNENRDEKYFKPMAKFNNKWNLTKGENRIIIKSINKEPLRIQLDKLGINQSTLFPEIEKVSKYVSNKYKLSLKT